MIKKRLIALLAHAKKYIAYQVMLQLLELFAQMVIVFQIGWMVQTLLMQTGQPFAMSILWIGICIVVKVVCDRLIAHCAYLASVDVKRILRERIYEKLLKLGSAYEGQASTAQIVQMSSEGVDQLEIYFGRYLPQFFMRC